MTGVGGSTGPGTGVLDGALFRGHRPIENRAFFGMETLFYNEL